jgi:hypothetical protein
MKDYTIDSLQRQILENLVLDCLLAFMRAFLLAKKVTVIIIIYSIEDIAPSFFKRN